MKIKMIILGLMFISSTVVSSLSFASGYISVSADDAKTFVCYAKAVRMIWSGYDPSGKLELSDYNVLVSLSRLGIIDYNFKDYTLVSIKKIKNPSKLLASTSGDFIHPVKVDFAYAYSVPATSASASYLSRQIENGLYEKIRSIPGCENSFTN